MISYQRAGQGKPLVFVHGFLAGSDMWRDQIEYFASNFDVIAIDLPGFGKSNDQLAPDTIEGFAQSVLDLLDNLDIEQFCLLGHSMGGMIVQQMAAMASDKITHLICYGTGAIGVLPDRFETIDTSRQKLKTVGLDKMSREIAATWFMDGAAAKKYPLCEELADCATEQAADASFVAWQKWDGRVQLSTIKAKTLVLWGEYDRSYGWPQIEILWRGIEGCSLAVVPGCAHNVHLEKPDLFNALLMDFLPK